MPHSRHASQDTDALPSKWSERSVPHAWHANRPAGAMPRRWYGGCLAGLALVALLVPMRQMWAVQVLLLPLLLTLPGIVLLRALRVPGRAVSSFPVYVPCASLVVLIATGLTVDLVGPLVGVTEPLRAGPLLAGLELTCLALWTSSLSAPPDTAIPWRSLSRPARLVWPLVLPLMAVAGALWLNNGHGNGLAVITVCAVIIALIWAFLYAPRLDKTLLAVTLYAAGLAMTWSSSLRGELVYGFDISTEYHDMNQAVVTGIWHTAHASDIYGAMLSVTVLPAELHALSGMPGLLLFNVVYPALYALFPVGVFSLARRILSRRWALLAPIFIMGEYFAGMEGAARVEIAFLFFVALVAAVLDIRISKRSRWVLVALLGMAVSVSHYSTDYIAITIMGIVLPLQWAASYLRDIPRVTGAVAIAFGATLLGAIVWYGPVTHSASNAAQFVQEVNEQGVDLLPNRAGAGNLLEVYLEGNTSQQISAARYSQLVHSYYAINRPWAKPFPDASFPQYALRNSKPPEPLVHWPPAYDLITAGDLIAQQLANLLAAVGAVMMVLYRKATVITRQVGLLALATLAVLAAARLSGTINMAYGQERALLQGFVLLAISLGWTVQVVSVRRRRRKVRKRRKAAVLAISALSLVVIYFNTTYLIGALLGGLAGIDLANSGPGYEYYYRTGPELASAEWLGKAVGPGQVVYADKYGVLPLYALTNIRNGLLLDITPLTLDQHAWVYASRTNVIDKQAFGQYKSYQASYVFPLSFLDANYNVVYTDGSSEVFHR
jgi:uncharacterized membrane protein